MDMLNVVFGLITIISFGLTIFYGIKSTRLEKQRKKLDWTDLQSCAKDLGNELKKTGFNPDMIFTPGLRGATFANLLQNEIVQQIPVYVGISYWKDSISKCELIDGYELIETSKWYVLFPKLPMCQKGKKILILDDYVMSGDFLKSTKKMLIDFGLDENNIKSMAVTTTKIAIESHKAPDYYWMTTFDSNFYFPWGKAR